MVGSSMRFGHGEANLLRALRHGVAEAHTDLERRLNLSSTTQHGDLVGMICGFHGFHAAWEPAMAHALKHDPFVVQRARLPLLTQDLRDVGHAASPPHCIEAAALVSCEAAALGSLYVMEGSTLGGQVIRKTLSADAWPRPGGPRYFNPYGRQTAAKWREFQTYLTARGANLPFETIVAGAQATFALLQTWLTPSPARAVS